MHACDFDIVLDHYGVILGSLWDHVGIILLWFWSLWDPFGSLRGSLGRPVALEAEFWGHIQLCNKNKHINQSIHRQVKRWTSKLERQHHLF